MELVIILFVALLFLALLGAVIMLVPLFLLAVVSLAILALVVCGAFAIHPLLGIAVLVLILFTGASDRE